MDEAIRELIHKTVDHESDAFEEERLQAILAHDPEARDEWEETTALVRMFARVGLVDPPPGWKEQLQAQLHRIGPPEALAGVRAAGQSPLEQVVAALRRRLSVRSAFVFVAGAAAGIAVLAGLNLRPQHLEESSPGSIMASRRLGPASPGHRVGEFEVDLATGRLTMRSSTDGRLSRVDIEAPVRGVLELDLEFDPQAVSLRDLEQNQPAGARIVIEAGRVHIEQQGSNRYELGFEAGGTGSVDIRIHVRSPDGMHAGSLSLLPSDGGS